MTYTTEQIRNLTALAYARRAKAGDNLCGLFEFALDEGWLGGIAAAVEMALDRGDTKTVEALRRLAASRTRPAPLPPRSPSSGDAPRDAGKEDGT